MWSHHFMANRWGNNGKSERLYCFGSKITADADCSHEIKRCLLLGRKAMTNLAAAAKSLQSCPTLYNPTDGSPPWAPLSLGFSRQEYWSGLPFPSPMTNLDSILKSRDITLPTKVYTVKAMFFSVVMRRCESWTIKKAEHQRIDAFEL